MSKCFFDIFSFDNKTDISHLFETKIKSNVKKSINLRFILLMSEKFIEYFSFVSKID